MYYDGLWVAMSIFISTMVMAMLTVAVMSISRMVMRGLVLYSNVYILQARDETLSRIH